MTEYLFLFHSTVGVVRMRKALQAAGASFRVKDIPRQLRGGCGLCIYLSCEPGEEQKWILPGKRKPCFASPGMIISCWLSFRRRRNQGANHRPAAYSEHNIRVCSLSPAVGECRI